MYQALGMVEMGKAIAEAKTEIIAHLSRLEHENQPSPSPREVVEVLAKNRNGEPFRAAITSLIASRIVEATPEWKLRLQIEPVTT